MLISIFFIIVIFAISFSLEPSNNNEKQVLFHVTLADSDLYDNGVYTYTFSIDSGEYYFRFVPNGSSPEILSITMKGDNFEYHEDFKLEGTSHQTGISEYYTWEYLGEKTISISEKQEVLITINPNGAVMGSVSVDILEI